MYFAILFQVAMGKPPQSFSHLKEIIIPGASLYVDPSIKRKPEVVISEGDIEIYIACTLTIEKEAKQKTVQS